MKNLLSYLLTFFFAGSVCVGQISYADIEYENIPHKKLVKYIQAQQDQNRLNYLSELKASCSDVIDFSDFFHYTRTYRVKDSIDNVWQTYIASNPTQAWKTRKSSCGMLYNRKDDKVIYPSDSCLGADTGQILFMNLKLLKGLYKLATSFEITKIADESGVIEISYTESGVNEGKQIIHMFSTDKGYTEIVHTSMIRSHSRFRDRYLYPYFHNRLINAFHRKMRKTIYQSAEYAKL